MIPHPRSRSPRVQRSRRHADTATISVSLSRAAHVKPPWGVAAPPLALLAGGVILSDGRLSGVTRLAPALVRRGGRGSQGYTRSSPCQAMRDRLAPLPGCGNVVVGWVFPRLGA